MRFITASFLLALVAALCLVFQSGKLIYLLLKFISQNELIVHFKANAQDDLKVIKVPKSKGLAILSKGKDSGGAILTSGSGFAGAGAMSS